MKMCSLLLLAFLVFFTVWGPLGPAAAGLPPGAFVIDAWARETRALRYERHESLLQFTSSRASDLGEDEIRGRFDVQSLQLNHLFVSTEPGNATALSYQFSFAALVEFQDVDGNGRFDLGDTVVNRTSLPGREKTTLEVEPRLDGGFRASVKVPLNESEESGLIPFGNQDAAASQFVLEIQLAPAAVESGDRLARPTETLLDFRLVGFPTTRNGTRVALEIRAQSSAELEAQVDRLAAFQSVFSTSYAWSPRAEVDGESVALGASVLETPRGAPGGESGQEVAILLAFPTGRSAQAETTAGVQRYQFPATGPADLVLPAPPGNLGLFLLGAGLSVVLIGGASLARLRRPG